MIPAPEISLVITTYNRAALLSETLTSVAESIIFEPQDYEVIVVNNNSSDNTAEVVKKFQTNSFPFALRYCFEPQQGLSHARNRGISEAHGEIIAFMDDDQIIDPIYLANLSMAFEQASAVCVGGKIIYRNIGQIPAWLNPLIKTIGQLDLGDELKILNGTGLLLKGGNIAFKKDALIRWGCFDTRLGRQGGQLLGAEEDELQRKIMAHSQVVAYHPILVQYNRILPEKFTKIYWRKHAYDYGRTCYRLAANDLSAVKHIGGVPGYLLINLVRHIAGYMSLLWHVNGVRIFQQELEIWGTLGAIAESRRSWSVK